MDSSGKQFADPLLNDDDQHGHKQQASPPSVRSLPRACFNEGYYEVKEVG